MIAVFAKLLSMKRIAMALLLSVTALCNTFGAGVTSKPESFSELQSAIETVLKETKTPGAAVVIVSREKVDWLAGIGKADVAANKPVTDETLFRIGSSSKAFAALAALQLQEEGRLRLTDTVKLRDLTPPTLPPAASVPIELQQHYGGYYELISPREQWLYPFVRLLNIKRLSFTPDGLHRHPRPSSRAMGTRVGAIVSPGGPIGRHPGLAARCRW